MATKTHQFLYLMQMQHNKILGYGITVNPKSRLQDYISHSLQQQEFSYLYFGEKMAIKITEKYINQLFKSDRLRMDEWFLEALRLDSNKTLFDIKYAVEDYIISNRLPIQIIKNEFLPFTTFHGNNDLTVKNILYSPKKYLTNINL